MPEIPPSRRVPPTWAALVIALGLYVSLRGYQSRVNDQAYRLPLLLARQDPSLFEDDPFVRAFETFNPHAGSLLVLDLASQPLGLSAGLFILYAITFALTFLGVDRSARAIWPDHGRAVGWVAFGLILTARAGNLGTNHLFEPILLDRLMALALGWLALASLLGDGRRAIWSVPVCLGLAGLLHPSLGLQLGCLAAGCLLFWSVWPNAFGLSRRRAMVSLVLLAAALGPIVLRMAHEGSTILSGMPEDEFRIWTLLVQSPQHMVPHLWRKPQWYAAVCYLILAGTALISAWTGRAVEPGSSHRNRDFTRRRFLTMVTLLLAGLGVAAVAIELVGDLRITLFQPFRMATVARGLTLVTVSARLLDHWRHGGFLGRSRAALVAVGLTGDWSLLVATLVEVAASLGSMRGRRFAAAFATIALVGGLVFLGRHDTQSGHVGLLAALLVCVLAGEIPWSHRLRTRCTVWPMARIVRVMTFAWIVPLAALAAPRLPIGHDSVTRAVTTWLLDRYRFEAIPRDDMERLAVWCRENTPADARFIGPPEPKTFRLWSLRSLAFNRAGSPYHAAGLADWSTRFRRHVDFTGSAHDFARAYLKNRQALERRYDDLEAERLAKLALAEKADYAIIRRESRVGRSLTNGAFTPLHAEGDFVVCRIHPEIRVADADIATSRPPTRQSASAVR